MDTLSTGTAAVIPHDMIYYQQTGTARTVFLQPDILFRCTATVSTLVVALLSTNKSHNILKSRIFFLHTQLQ
jgi:hypothetical protein